MVSGEDEQTLGDNYFFLPKYEALDVGYPDGAIIYKSPEKNLFKEIKIKKEVVSVEHNRDFIIAIQESNNNSFEIGNSHIEERNFLNYFIIVKKTNHVYGPFKYSDYVSMRKELKVPNNLMFK